MKITKKVLKEMIKEIVAGQVDISKILSPDVKKNLEGLGPALGLPAAATAVDVAKKIASDAEKAGKDAVAAVKAIATTEPKTADEAAKIIQGAPDTGLAPLKIGAMSKMPANKSMARTSDPDLFVGMQTTGPNLPAVKKIKDKAKKVARKKIRKRKCSKLPLRIGCQGPLVKEIQKLLIYVGFGRQLGPTGADGDYGRATRRAVKAFQKDEELQVDGVAGKNTVAALKNIAKDMRKDIKSGQPAALATDASPGKPKKATKATAAKKDDRLDTPLLDDGVPVMSRVEALRATREDMVPVSAPTRFAKKYRRPANVRFLAIKAIKYLMDELGVEPGRAYYDLMGVFGLGGARYIEPAELAPPSSLFGKKNPKIQAAARKFVKNLEDVTGIEFLELAPEYVKSARSGFAAELQKLR